MQKFLGIFFFLFVFLHAFPYSSIIQLLCTAPAQFRHNICYTYNSNVAQGRHAQKTHSLAISWNSHYCYSPPPLPCCMIFPPCCPPLLMQPYAVMLPPLLFIIFHRPPCIIVRPPSYHSNPSIIPYLPSSQLRISLLPLYFIYVIAGKKGMSLNKLIEYIR